jgi:hypothetical protein
VCIGTYVAWKPYLSAMTDMTSLSGFLSSRYSVRIVFLNDSHASAGTCSLEGRLPICDLWDTELLRSVGETMEDVEA